jgi:hypothetical protein
MRRVELANINHWELVWTWNGVADTDPKGIQEQICPITFSSKLLLVYPYSPNGRATWRWAGYANQRLSTNLLVGGAFDTNVTADRRSLWLRRMNLLPFDRWQSEYAVSFEFPVWFPDASLQVWQYIGPDVDVIFEQNAALFAALRSQLGDQDSKLDQINSSLDILLNDYYSSQ